MRTDYLKKIDFIKKYNWNGDWSHDKKLYVPENRCQWIFGDDLFYKPWHGVRGDGGIEHIKQPSDIEDMDYLMHAQYALNYQGNFTMEIYYHFMRKYVDPNWVPPPQRKSN